MRLSRTAAIAATALLAAATTLNPLVTNDLWVHLAVGRETTHDLLSGAGIPKEERFSFTAAGHPLVPHEWLSELVFYGCHAVAGPAGVQALRLTLVLATLAGAVLAARIAGAEIGTIFWTLFLLLLAIAPRLQERPHLFTYGLAAGMTALLAADVRAAPSGGLRALWSLVPLMVLWANLHGGFIVGIFLIAAFTAAAAWSVWRARAGTTRTTATGRPAGQVWKRLRRLLAVLVLSVLAVSVLNPAGPSLLLFPFQLAGSDIITERILEWRSPLSGTYWKTIPFLLTAFWGLLLAAAAGIAGWLPAPGVATGRVYERRTERAADRDNEGRQESESQGIRDRQPQRPHKEARTDGPASGQPREPEGWALPGLLVGLLFGYLALRQMRSVADFAVFTAPWMATSLDGAWRALKLRPIPGRELWPAGAAVGAAALIFLFGYPVRPLSRMRCIPPLVGESVPVAPAEFIAAQDWLPPGARLFNSYTLGGYLEWRFAGRLRILIDSRNEAYGDQLTGEILQSFREAGAFEKAMKKWRPHLLVLAWRQLGAASPVLKRLENGSGWSLVYMDDLVAIYAPEERAARPLRFASPGSFDILKIGPKEAPEALAEGRLLRSWQPEGVVASLVTSRALMVSGRKEEGREVLERCAALDPDSPALWSLLAAARSVTGDREGASRAMRHATELAALAPQ